MTDPLKRILLFISLSFIIPFGSPGAEERHSLRSEDVLVFFDVRLDGPASEVLSVYPKLKAELEERIGWTLDFRPVVLLIRERDTFQRMAGTDLFVAFAVPRRQLIVIDHSKMRGNPFTLAITLKHEMCHLLLHHHIRKATLPKWMDEGVAQWVSDGMSELIMDKKRSVLDEVVLSGNYIRIRSLTHRFPKDKISLLLAYEESKSLVAYIHDKFGESAILALLNHLKAGDDVDAAIRNALSVSLGELESQWHRHLRRERTWFVYVASHLYDILFFLAALTAIVGFVKLMIRKRMYKDQDDEDDEEAETEE